MSTESTTESSQSDIEDTSSKFARLRAKRGGNRSFVTKLQAEVATYIESRASSYAEPNVISRLDSISESLTTKKEYFKLIDEEILGLCTIEEIEKEIEESSDWETRINETLGKIRNFKQGRYRAALSSITSRQPSTAPVTSTPLRDGTPSNDQPHSSGEGNSNSDLNLSSQSHTSSASFGVKLPKISLPRFNGEITRFPSFWQSFDCAVNQNPSVSAVQKFNYLLSLLDGQAFRALQGLEITGENYQPAVEILKSRFGNKQQIINDHMSALLRLQSHPNERVTHLRYILDSIIIHVRGLESLGMPSERYGSLLIPIIMNRMPKEITCQVAKKITQEIWPIEEILEIIRSEVEAKEFSEKVAASKPTEKPVSPRPRQKHVQGTTRSFAAKVEKGPPTCVFCNEQHLSINCSKITDVKERKTLIQKAKFCFCCLKPGHQAKTCDKNCRKCGGHHHQTICFRNSSVEGKPNESSETSSLSASAKSKETVLMMTASAYVYGSDMSQRTKVTILFDSGSQRSYVSEKLARQLTLDAKAKETVNLNTFGSTKYSKLTLNSVVVNVEVENSEIIPVSALTHNVICTPLSPRMNIGNFPHLHGLALADCFEDANPKRIDLLIGLDAYFNFIQGDVIHGKPKEPVALRSKLGWIVSGSVRNDSSNSNSFSSTNLILEGFDSAASENFQENEIVSTLKEFWQHEACGLYDIHDKKSTEKTTPSSPQHDHVSIVHNGERYETNLPFNSNPQGLLPSNYKLCSSRLNSLIKKLRANPSLLAEYDAIIREQLDTGIIERVSKDAEQQENCHFLPHHCVVRQDHDTTKVRIVFDGSARESKETPSINDVLASGENFMPHLFDTIIRFRSHTIGFTGDLQKAFHQISIRESDRDFLRFLWVDNLDKLEPAVVQFRFCRLPFGLKPSPSILGATLNKHASLFENTEPHIAKIIKGMYADDLSCGAGSANAVLEIMHKSRAIMKEAGFNLCKFKSNDPEVRCEIAKLEVATKGHEVKQQVVEDSETFTRSTIGLPHSESESNTKVLGINWDTNNDRFFCELSKVIEFAASLPPTKRSLLKIAAKIFDPLGCLSVYTINLKILFQQLCFSKLSWDEELQGDTRVHYNKLLQDMNVLQGAYIPRSLFFKGKGVSSVQIHAFSDASEIAYATVVYLRILYDSGEVDVQFIAAKAKVSPLKKHSIPRLELIGATLMAKFVSTISRNLQEELGYAKPISTYFWVDSMVTLCWILNFRNWTQFVRRRVNQILEFSSREDWYFCPGALNPADLPSRGKFQGISSSNSLWWKGPAYLRSPPSEWPTVDRGKVIEENAAYSEEIKSQIQVTHAMVNMQDEMSSVTNIIELQRFSSKRRLVRTIAWVLRFVHNVKAAVSSKKSDIDKELNVNEIETAERLLIRDIQRNEFKDELQFLLSKAKNSSKVPIKVNQFNLFIDEHGILRCRSRLSNADIPDAGKYPILLPARNLFSRLAVLEAHGRVFHNGIRETLNCLRQKYWVLRGREIVKAHIRNCVICKKLEGLPFKFNLTPSLPLERVENCVPFSFTGVDFAGPLEVKDLCGQHTFKAYICLFTCATTRAVHLEIVESLSTESFIKAFRKFTARRGLPVKILSDNAKTFKTASKEVRKLFRCPKLHSFLTNKGVEWTFIPEKSPWEGGIWERLVRSVKRCLVKVIGRAMVSFMELGTILVEIEGVVNSRPLTYVFDDTEGVSFPLTPSHLLNGRNLLQEPNDRFSEIISTYETLSKRAKYHFRLLWDFSKRWKGEYLYCLMETFRSKQNPTAPSISVGDLVILRNDNTKRSFWKVCRVKELLKDRDGNIRTARIMVPTDKGKVQFIRPLKYLVPIEVSSKQSINSQTFANPIAAPARTATGQACASEAQKAPLTRPRRNAAVVGEVVRRDMSL